MGIYDAWKRLAYDKSGQPVKHVWDDYLTQEKGVYEVILRDKTQHIEGSVAEIGRQLGLSTTYACAFLEGIQEAVDGVPDMPSLTEDTPITLDIDFARLYKQMVAYKAEALYTLPQWNDIFTLEEQKQLYMAQKKSHTVVRNEAKVGRNDPCPCGSGKKYKKCCGA